MNAAVRHTPGPFVIDCTNAAIERAELKDGTPLHTIADHDRRAIAFVSMIPDEADANLHLFRATPELLEALRRLLPFAENDAFRDGSDPDEDKDVLFARAAIAKAEGRS